MRLIKLSILAVAAALLVAAPYAMAASPHDQADEAEIAALDLDAAGKFDDALVKHRLALQLWPNNKAFKENFVSTLYKAALAKHDAKDDTTAVALLEEAVTAAPTFKPAQDSLAALKTGKLNQDGIALMKAGNYAGAAAKFTEILKLDPSNKAVKINLDVAEAQLLIKDDPAGAVAKLQDAVSLLSLIHI